MSEIGSGKAAEDPGAASRARRSRRPVVSLQPSGSDLAGAAIGAEIVQGRAPIFITFQGAWELAAGRAFASGLIAACKSNEDRQTVFTVISQLFSDGQIRPRTGDEAFSRFRDEVIGVLRTARDEVAPQAPDPAPEVTEAEDAPPVESHPLDGQDLFLSGSPGSSVESQAIELGRALINGARPATVTLNGKDIPLIVEGLCRAVDGLPEPKRRKALAALRARITQLESEESLVVNGEGPALKLPRTYELFRAQRRAAAPGPAS